MKVRDLIEKLQQFNPEADFYAWASDKDGTEISDAGDIVEFGKVYVTYSETDDEVWIETIIDRRRLVA